MDERRAVSVASRLSGAAARVELGTLHAAASARKLLWAQMITTEDNPTTVHMRHPWLVRAGAALLLSVCNDLGSSAHAQSTAPLATTEADTEAEDSTAFALCKTDLRLSGAIYDSARPRRSFVVIQAPTDRAGTVYRVGMMIGGYRVVTVAPRGVMLRNDDGECWLRLVGEPSRGGRTTTAVQAKPSKRAKKRARARASKKAKDVAVIGGAAR